MTKRARHFLRRAEEMRADCHPSGTETTHSIMRRLPLAALLPLAFGLCAFAATATDIRAKAGQPFCPQEDDLHEYLLALIQKNIDNCIGSTAEVCHKGRA
jgi:hypothetical protein